MRTKTAVGVNLSQQEFHGIMEAVQRRINRLANLGHPDAPVGNAQPLPPSPGPLPQANWSQMFQPQEDQDASALQ